MPRRDLHHQDPWHPPQRPQRRLPHGPVTTGWCLTLFLASIMLAPGGARRAFPPTSAHTPPHHHLPSIPPTNLASAIVTHDTTGAAAMAFPQDEDISIVVSTVDGAVYTMDAWTGQPKSAFYSGPPLYSSSFFPGGSKFQPIVRANQKFFVVPTHEGKIVCVREDGTQEILASNVLDLLNSPVMICPDYNEECGVLFGEKTTKIFALDSLSGEVRWVNNRYKLPAGADQEPFKTNGRNPVLLQRDDYVIRSINAENGLEEWNVTLADIFAIETFDFRPGREDKKGNKYGHGMVQPSVEWVDDRTVQVVHPTTGSVLWRKELPTSPISMYTVHGDRWFTVDFPKVPLGDRADKPLGGDLSSALIPSDRATLVDLSQRKSMRISLPSNRLQPSHLLPPQPLVEDTATVTERDLATLRQMRQLGLADSVSLSPFFLHARHQQRYHLQHAQAHGGCLNDRCHSFTANEVIPYTMYDIQKECANGNCGGMLDPVKSKNPLFQEQGGFCSPMDGLPQPPFPKSENKILTTGMFMTWETVGTLVVVVFTVAIGTVVLVFRYQDRTNQSAAESARFFAHLIETEEQSRRLSDAVSMIANGGTAETTSNNGSGHHIKSDAVGLGLSRSGTSSADYLDISNTSLSSSWHSQRPLVETRQLTAPSEEQPLSSRDISQNSTATTFSSFCSTMSKFNGPLALTQACMTREADPSCGTMVAARAILGPAELQRSYSLPSLPPPRVNGNVTVESRESSRGGLPTTVKDDRPSFVDAAFKGMSEAISPTIDDPPISFPSFSATANPMPSSAGNNPLMAMVAHSQSQPLTTTTSTALVKSSLSCSPPRMSSTESMATTIETISDASGNPILFLSTSRYKNEFHETNKLGKGGA